MLARAEEIAGAAQLQILLGYLEAVVRFGHDLQTRLSRLVIIIGDEHAIAFVLAAPDAAAQLVQLAQTETVGIFDYHKRRIRHVHADLNHRGGNKDIYISSNEALHNVIFLFGLELAVDAGHFEIGEIFLKLGGVLLRGFDFRRKLLVFLDHRAYDKHLPAFGNKLADKAVQARAIAFRHGKGIDLLPARRHLVDY